MSDKEPHLVRENEPHLMWAEAIRDIGILLLVFAPLDTLLTTRCVNWKHWLIALGIAIAGYLLIRQGVKMGSSK